MVEGTDTLGVLLKRSTAGCWVNVLDSVRPGDLFTMYVSYQNNTAEQQDDVSVRVLLPDGFEYSPGTTSIMNSETGGVLSQHPMASQRSGTTPAAISLEATLPSSCRCV